MVNVIEVHDYAVRPILLYTRPKLFNMYTRYPLEKSHVAKCRPASLEVEHYFTVNKLQDESDGIGCNF